ncbi:Uncharacterised protein g10081 [Pycnogonum litorale]
MSRDDNAISHQNTVKLKEDKPNGVVNDSVDCNKVLHDACFSMQFKHVALFCVGLPLVTLAMCFITAILFQGHLINDTRCKVYNFIPSISAVTGIFPQCYVWRITIALHCTPRFIMASMYKHLYCQHSAIVSYHRKSIYDLLTKLTYWLHLTEILSLVGVTYISNKDNYPIHEKFFILFMFSSIAHMLASLLLSNMANIFMSSHKIHIYKMKCLFFIAVCVGTVGLLYYFYRHRFFCDELAFTWFSLFEYVICVSNMSFHGLIAWDFDEERFLVAKITSTNDSKKQI